MEAKLSTIEFKDLSRLGSQLEAEMLSRQVILLLATMGRQLRANLTLTFKLSNGKFS